MNILNTGFQFSKDGPGNRLVIHTQGCNFHCPWCSNPESMAPGAEATHMTADEIVTLALRSRPMFYGGGGVTFTGGEPTLQFEELKACLSGLKAHGINTAIETNGSHPALCTLAPLLDHIMIDLKQPDEEIHRKWTGASPEQTKDNIRALLRMKTPVLVRTPLINGVNTDPAPFVRFFESCETETLTYEILPYHEYGRDKWTKPYTMQNGFVTQEQIDLFRDAIEKTGVKIVNT